MLLFTFITDTPEQIDLCYPSPCGPYSQCSIVNESPICSCLPDYQGTPPYCKPECISNDECSNELACMNQKCKNPCSDACGVNADCYVVNHATSCFCQAGFTGNPFIQCTTVQSMVKLRVLISIFDSVYQPHYKIIFFFFFSHWKLQTMLSNSMWS